MPVQQKQNIKGFTLLEILVILAIIGLLAGISYPNFSEWSRDRALRLQSEKIASLLTRSATQVERGYYAYVRVEFTNTSPASINVNGITQSVFSKKIRGASDPTCSESDFKSTEWIPIASHTLDKKTFSPLLMPLAGDLSKGSNSAICFSKGGKYFKQTGNAPGRQPIKAKPNSNSYILLCHVKATPCAAPISFSKEYPTYAIVYSRVGLITKYKWRNSWINQ